MPPSGVITVVHRVVGASRPVGRGDGRQDRATDAKARFFPFHIAARLPVSGMLVHDAGLAEARVASLLGPAAQR